MRRFLITLIVLIIANSSTDLNATTPVPFVYVVLGTDAVVIGRLESLSMSEAPFPNLAVCEGVLVAEEILSAPKSVRARKFFSWQNMNEGGCDFYLRSASPSRVWLLDRADDSKPWNITPLTLDYSGRKIRTLLDNLPKEELARQTVLVVVEQLLKKLLQESDIVALVTVRSLRPECGGAYSLIEFSVREYLHGTGPAVVKIPTVEGECIEIQGAKTLRKCRRVVHDFMPNVNDDFLLFDTRPRAETQVGPTVHIFSVGNGTNAWLLRQTRLSLGVGTQ